MEVVFMKVSYRKMFVSFLAAAALLNFSGCEKKSTYSDPIDDVGSIAEDDLPYGSTIVQLKPEIDENIKMSIEYDRRFVTEEEAVKISDYMFALNNADGELMETVVYPDYLEKIKSDNGLSSTTDYLNTMIENIKTQYTDNEDFTFNYILVNDCLDDTSSDTEDTFSILDDILDTYANSKGKEPVSSKITSRKLVKIDTMYTLNESGGSYSLTNRTGADQQLYLYTIDGQLYIL